MSEAATAKPSKEKTETKSSRRKRQGIDFERILLLAPDKSARESVGGKSEVHYGYFSNVKTPEYRSGWDSIWGGEKSNGTRRKRAAPSSARPKSPLRLTLDFGDLPEAAQDELRKAAKAALKSKSRLSLARREQADAVSWTIECEVRR